METLDQQYQKLLTTAQADTGVIALILAGSRGKGIVTEHSDYDIFIITDDAIIESAKVKYQPFTTHAMDITIMGERELSLFGVWGSDTMWSRYNFAHIKAAFDKTGEIQKWLSTQESIPALSIEDAIKESLDSYLNYTHHSLKNSRDRRQTAAHLAACDAMPQLITFLFAAEGRVRPYNEYLEWELGAHPLVSLPLKPDEFVKKIGLVLADGNEAVQKELLLAVRNAAAKSKIGAEVLNAWKDYYFG